MHGRFHVSVRSLINDGSTKESEYCDPEKCGNQDNVANRVLKDNLGNKTIKDKQTVSRVINHEHDFSRELKEERNRTELHTHAELISERIQHAKHKCEDYNKLPVFKNLEGNLQGAVYSIQNKLNYCETPKVGCTYWKSVLRFVTGDYPKKMPVRQPSDINRRYVHFGQWKHIKRYRNLNEALQSGVMSTGKNFMFVREPYSRLWSAYLDKFYLPDFWETGGPKFRHNYRTACVNNVTFQEFLSYIVDHSKKLNIHWNPIYRLCSPCHVTYDVIGKLETFGDDSKFILKDFKFDRIQDIKDRKSRAKEEILMLTRYNFNFSTKNSCFHRELIAKRLWSVFKMNGYIHENSRFPTEIIGAERFKVKKEYAVSEFVKYAFKTLDIQDKQGLDLKYQRSKYMLEGYNAVPLSLLYKVKQLYKYDFELFGYDPEPRDIFSR